MNQKSIIAILGVVVVILIGTTVYFATIKKATAPVTPTVQQPIELAPTNETANWQTYTNTQYGFQLTFPDSWKEGFGVDDSSSKGELGVSFHGRDGFNIFSLNSAPIKDKNTIAKSNQGCIVGQTDKILVIASGCCSGVQSNPKTDPYADLCNEVPAILKTFKAVK